jgi:hypothetical protein
LKYTLNPSFLILSYLKQQREMSLNPPPLLFNSLGLLILIIIQNAAAAEKEPPSRNIAHTPPGYETPNVDHSTAGEQTEVRGGGGGRLPRQVIEVIQPAAGAGGYGYGGGGLYPPGGIMSGGYGGDPLLGGGGLYGPPRPVIIEEGEN